MKIIHAEIDIGRKVDLVDNEHIQTAINVGVFVGLVVAFGHGSDKDVGVRAKLESGRADEVADVLDDDQIQILERQLCQRHFDHVGIQMAIATGVDLDCGHAGCDDFVCVNRDGGSVSFDHAKLDPGRQPFDGLKDETGFSSSRRSHQVDAINMVLVQDGLVVLCQAIVGIHDSFNNFNALGHLEFLSEYVNVIHQQFFTALDVNIGTLTLRAALKDLSEWILVITGFAA